MENLVNLFFSERSYSALFKAGVFLLGLSLLAISQVGTFLYDKDIEAHTERFKIEEISGKALEDTDCTKLNGKLTDCRIAKHKSKTLDSGLALLLTIVKYSMWSGFALTMLSLFIFLVTAFRQNNEPSVKA